MARDSRVRAERVITNLAEEVCLVILITICTPLHWHDVLMHDMYYAGKGSRRLPRYSACDDPLSDSKLAFLGCADCSSNCGFPSRSEIST